VSTTWSQLDGIEKLLTEAEQLIVDVEDTRIRHFGQLVLRAMLLTCAPTYGGLSIGWASSIRRADTAALLERLPPSHSTRTNTTRRLRGLQLLVIGREIDDAIMFAWEQPPRA
jgi:hypothetical protein